MKKIKENEPFQLGNRIFTYTITEGKIQLIPGKKVKKFVPPTEQEVKTYFAKNSYTEESAITFHKYYTELEWKDKNGSAVVKWKAKAISTWFKDQNRIKTPSIKSDAPQGINFFQQ